MRRLLRRGLLLALALVALLASPVVYVETMCRGDAVPAPALPLSAETRPEVRTLLTYPEWHIVHAYDDYAEVIRTGDPQDYGFTRAVTGYWGALCTLTRESAALGEIDTATRQLVHVIGVSFTVEMAMKALYEETLGRLATLVRGETRAPLDDLSAAQAATYARFLQQVPWYRYDFRADAAALRAAATDAFRDRERAFALGLEHRARAAYAGVIAGAVAATGADDLTLQMVVAGLPPEALEAVEGVTVLRPVEDGWEVETPRYRALTVLLAGWAEAGATFRDMAGNDRILFTAISDAPEAEGALLSLPRQGYGDTRHLFLVDVPELAERLRGLAAAGLRLEHVHDY
ncbi:hypothetical protein [Roseicyclus persicicus]|uniref:Uncharacterized protein n=1 Tax=Roseicyclus persicicus TaxID=2650661 RepID=A0A7X6GZM4_9RHOB|nr:hypothetical protein [Roseibacterium persicicum]NKX44047.1 hypothetical protein [Roseibacterium persicicum]